MKFKQKLVYMFIGCLFTIAGYFIATLANNQLQDAHAQKNEKEVIDEIVCRQIKVINRVGETMVVIKESSVGGWMTLHNAHGEAITLIRPGMYSVYASPGRRDHNNVPFDLRDKVEQGGKETNLKLYEQALKDLGDLGDKVEQGGKEVLYIGPGLIKISGGLRGHGEPSVLLGATFMGGIGYINVYGEKGKDLVSISAIEGRPNDGLINVYNHKGEWRSISKD
jgi:hypothetical protein